MIIEFSGKIWVWRGPAPWYFVTVPEKHSQYLTSVSSYLTYGWGVLPLNVQIGKTTWKTSLFPKDDLYIVPIKAAIRKAEKIKEGDEVTVRLNVDV